MPRSSCWTLPSSQHVIRAKHRMADRSGYFALGELSARCLDAAREAGEKGVSPAEIAVKAMADTQGCARRGTNRGGGSGGDQRHHAFQRDAARIRTPRL